MHAHQVVEHRELLGASGPRIRVLIVDDHTLIRQVVRETLEEHPDFVVCAEAADDPQARRLVAADPPDVALVDLSLGDTNGIDLIEWIVAHYPAIRILVLSMHDAAVYAPRAARAGAHGYISKRDAPFSMIDSIRKVVAPRGPPAAPPIQ
jgi:DNA-binding NarL/FixJ family response regulator